MDKIKLTHEDGGKLGHFCLKLSFTVDGSLLASIPHCKEVANQKQQEEKSRNDLNNNFNIK